MGPGATCCAVRSLELPSRSLPVVVILALPALAGCLGGDSSGPDGASEASSATATDVTGGIEGSVVNDEQVPVAGATVGIRRSAGSFGNETTTSGSGRFAFSGLEPGSYEIAAVAAFHQPAGTAVTVEVGRVVEVTITLVPLAPTEELYYETIPARGYITCSVGYFLLTGTYTMNPCQEILGNDANFLLPLRADLAFNETILELVWQPTTAATGTELRMILCSEKDATTNFWGQCLAAVGVNPYYQSVAGPPPLVLRRNDLPLEEVASFEVAVGDAGADAASPRVPVTFQQPFDLYMTLCYFQPCDEDFQARPPG